MAVNLFTPELIMKKNRIQKAVFGLFAAALCMTAFTGCGKSRSEQQAEYTDSGLEALANGDYENADSYFDKALDLAGMRVGEDEIKISYYKAEAQALSGDYEGALTTCDNLISYNEKDQNAYFLKGSIAYLSGDTDGAVTDYNSAVSVSDQDYELCIHIYENLNARGDTDDALPYLNQALSFSGNSAEDCYQKGRIYLLLSKYDKAESLLNTAVDKGKDEAMIVLSEVYSAEGDEEKAHDILTKYVDKGTATAESCEVMGDLLMNQGDYQGALSSYRKGLKMKSPSNRQELMKGEIGALEAGGSFDKAYTKAKSYIKEYPSDQEMIREIRFLSNL